MLPGAWLELLTVVVMPVSLALPRRPGGFASALCTKNVESRPLKSDFHVGRDELVKQGGTNNHAYSGDVKQSSEAANRRITAKVNQMRPVGNSEEPCL